MKEELDTNQEHAYKFTQNKKKIQRQQSDYNISSTLTQFTTKRNNK